MDLSDTPQPVAAGVDMDQHEVGRGTRVVVDFVVGNFELAVAVGCSHNFDLQCCGQCWCLTWSGCQIGRQPPRLW